METGVRGQSVVARVGGMGSRSWCATLLASACLLFTACIPSSDSPGPASDLANLSGLELADSAQQKVGLSPAFSGDTTNYTADVGGAIANITIRPTAINASGNTTIRIQKPDGSTTPITSGQVSPALPVNFGTNSFTVTVDAPGATKAYVLVVTRGANANLNALSLSAGGLTPAFQPATTDYTAKTGFTTPTTTVTATLSDTSSTLTVNGQAANSGQATAPIQLNTGSTKIAIAVRSQNGQTKTYTIDVVRAGTSDLSKLEVQGHPPVDPGFDPSNTGPYSAAVPFGEGSVNIVPTAADSSATITINGQSATSGQKFPVSLSPGVNSYSIVVTGPSVAPKTYSLNITLAPASTNAKLSGLSVDEGALQPGFASNTFGYVVTVGSSTSSVHVTATTDDSASSLSINNQGASSGQKVTVGLNGGAPSTTVIPIVVTAQSGAAQSYTITVNKAAPASGNANLQSLAVPPASISFNQATTTYNTSVPNGTGAVTVNAVVADSGSTMTINGQAVQSPSNFNVPLNVGNNTITVRVRAAAGNTRDYVVNVNRAAAASSDATLTNLTVAGATVPGFSSGNGGPYTVTLPFGTSSATVVATRSSNSANVFIDGSQTTSQPVSLAGGPSTKTVKILVIAQDTVTTKTYTVDIKVAAPPPPVPTVASLALTSGSPLVAGGASGTMTVTLSSAPGVATTVALGIAPSGVLGVTSTSVPFVAGQLSADFNVTGIAAGTATVTATLGASSKSTDVTVAAPPPPAPTVASLTLTSGSPLVAGGASGTMTVTLSSAPSVATTVALGIAPSGVLGVTSTSVPFVAGQLSADFNVTGIAAGTATVTATLGASSKSTDVTVAAPPPPGP